MHRALSAITAFFALSAPALAQLGNEWVSYQRQDGRLGVLPSAISNSSTEVDFAWGDLDRDGWTDLVVVRKEPVTTFGKRTNMLLMNECGALMDRTALYAAQSDVAGDQGFLTPTNDRDVVLADVDGDAWLDVITATTLSDGNPKHIGHPRVYRNLGEDGSGNWLGLVHEDARIPQLLVGGSPANPRFCAVDAGDVTGDGHVDLYFGDYDSGPQPHPDMNDRLLVNDGNGYFTDESTLRMTSTMLQSAFGMAVVIEDMNLDGFNDIVKDTALNAPQYVSASYNDPGNPGFFDVFDDFHDDQPYHTAVGDLNNDGRPDAVMTDDFEDRYRYNLSTDVFGRVVWGPSKTFVFAGIGFNDDDGFGGNNLIVDLDLDGWNDVIIADVDVDIAGCERRTHIYHNPGGAVGSQITLIEERGPFGDPWRGVEGMLTSDLTGTHDVAVFDVNNDGRPDMVFGRCNGTFVWMQDSDTVDGTKTYCVANPNSTGNPASMGSAGSNSVAANDLQLTVEDARPNAFGLFFYGPGKIQVPFGDGFRCVGGGIFRLNPVLSTDATGAATKSLNIDAPPAPGGQITPSSTWNFQFWYRDPMGPGGSGFNLSDGLSATFCP